MYKCTKI